MNLIKSSAENDEEKNLSGVISLSILRRVLSIYAIWALTLGLGRIRVFEGRMVWYKILIVVC